MSAKSNLMDDYQHFITTSRYSRWLEEENRRETWAETVTRYMDNVVAPHVDGATYEELYQAVLNLEVMPSMRAMMTSGKALSRDNTCGYNCSYLPVDSPRSFDEAMFILLCGTGVGFSVERQYVSKLPVVPEAFTEASEPIVVGDSKEGWATAYKKLLESLWKGVLPTWDVSGVRPAGAKLKTFGGRASGPAPLEDLFNFTISKFKGAAGRKLNSLECHDIMCKIGQVVVVGGVRRSAMISLSNLSDNRMRYAKSGDWYLNEDQRSLSNNSVAYTEKPDMETFMREWLSLMESKSGERGLFNREASKAQVSKNGRRDPNHEWGTNPCCFTGDMKLLTDKGYERFDSLSGKDVNIVNPEGNTTKGTVWSSGVKPTVFVQFEAGLGKDPIQVTPDHVFMLADGAECEAGDLKGKRVKFNYKPMDSLVGSEGFLAGFMLGDGGLTRMTSPTHKGLEVYFDREKDEELSKAYGGVKGPDGSVKSYSKYNLEVAERYDLPPKPVGKRGLPDSVTSQESLQGLFSANGSVISKYRVALKSTDKEQVVKLKEVLGSFNIESYITVNKAKKSKFLNGEYSCKESYDLNITRYQSLINFAEQINFGQNYKREALNSLLSLRSPRVRNVVEGPEAEVFDFTEPETHWGVVEGVVVHNSEIILRPFQFCNLTEIVARKEDTVESLQRKVRLAAILGTVQSNLTKFPYLRKIWKDNTEEERLLGVSITGILDNSMLSKQGKDLEDLLSSLKGLAVETNAKWAKKLGINPSASVTCVKPSGTVSQLTNSASGIHPRHSAYYIRSVRADNKDPMTDFMKSVGIPHEPCVMKPMDTSVFSFPIRSPKNAVTRDDLTALDQLNLWLTYQRFWCEHKPSITVSVREHEWLEVGAFVYEHFDEMSGVSFLPHSDHVYAQAPYQECSREDYEKAVRAMPLTIDWSKLADFESEDSTVGSSTFACSGDVCEIVDLT